METSVIYHWYKSVLCIFLRESDILSFIARKRLFFFFPSQKHNKIMVNTVWTNDSLFNINITFKNARNLFEIKL